MVTILVIDDEPVLRQQVNFFLSKQGYNVIEACDGQEGIVQAVALQPDLIICDIMMPKIDGYQVLHWLSRNSATRQIPFIFLTALADFSRMRKGMKLGADDYLTKPFTHQELVEAVEMRLLKQQVYQEDAENRLKDIKHNVVKLVANELTTPLAPIKTVTHLISRKLGNLSDRELLEYMTVIRSGTHRITHLIQQIVYLTELEAGLIDADIIGETGSNQSIAGLLRSSVRLAREYATRNEDTEIEVDIQDEDLHIFGITALLEHAISEIIINAVHFGDGKPVTLKQWCSKDRAMCWIAVSDAGPGISQSAIEQMMHAPQSPNSHDDPGQKSGLGLNLARLLIDLHGGNLQLNRLDGGGTRVRIGLPYVVSHSPAAKVSSTAHV